MFDLVWHFFATLISTADALTDNRVVGYFCSTLFCWVFGFFVILGIFYMLRGWSRKSFHLSMIENKQRFRDIDVAELKDRLGESADQDQDILSLSLVELIDDLQEGRVKPTAVLEAYQRAALRAHDRLNVITLFLKDSREAAAKLDSLTAEQRKQLPLYGVPFSVKDNFHVTGYATSCGLAKQADKTLDEECTLVAHLRSLGAVPFVKTNVPQSLLNYVCSNPLWGTTGNPYDPDRVPGGSSGGECALVAAGGSAFGIGSDLAGSLRIPAHMCGLVTLKPTASRLIVNNADPGVPGACKIELSYGFFTRSVEEQQLLLSLTVTERYYTLSPRTVPNVFRTDAPQKPSLRFGLWIDNDWFPPTPPIERALLETKTALEAQGHEVVTFDVPDAAKAFTLGVKAMVPDNGSYLKNLFSYEPIDEHMVFLYRMLFMPVWLRRVAAVVVEKVVGWPRVATILKAVHPTLGSVRANHAAVDAYRRQFDDHFKAAEIDALLCAPFPFPAIAHKYPSQLSVAALNTLIFNVLDYPAGVVPTTKVTEKDVEAMADYPNNDLADKLVHEAMIGSEGLPVTVQVVTPPHSEELCLHAMSCVEKAVKKSNH